MTDDAKLGKSRVMGTNDVVTEKILDIVLDKLISDGYASVDIEGVAKAANCAKTTIYRRWSGKPALVSAAILKRATVGQDPDTGCLHDDLVEFSVINVQNQQDMLLSIAMSSGPEVIEQLWANLFSDRQNLAMKILERAVERGELPQETDLIALIDLISGYLLFRNVWRGSPPTRRQISQVVDSIINYPPRLESNNTE